MQTERLTIYFCGRCFKWNYLNNAVVQLNISGLYFSERFFFKDPLFCVTIMCVFTTEENKCTEQH